MDLSSQHFLLKVICRCIWEGFVKLWLHSFLFLLQAFLIRSYDMRIWFYNVHQRYCEYICSHGNPYIKSCDDRQVVQDKKVKLRSEVVPVVMYYFEIVLCWQVKKPWSKVLDRLEDMNDHLEKMDKELNDLRRRVIQCDNTDCIRAPGSTQL